MNIKTSDTIWDDHDQYVICLYPNESYCVYKNGQFHNKYEIEECPAIIQESLRLELGRIKNNKAANTNK